MDSLGTRSGFFGLEISQNIGIIWIPHLGHTEPEKMKGRPPDGRATARSPSYSPISPAAEASRRPVLSAQERWAAALILHVEAEHQVCIRGSEDDHQPWKVLLKESLQNTSGLLCILVSVSAVHLSALDGDIALWPR